jgi:pentatricopeptide repeat protein
MYALDAKTGLYLDVYADTCLVDLYAKCGKLTEAMLLFEQMDRRMIRSLECHHSWPWGSWAWCESTQYLLTNATGRN